MFSTALIHKFDTEEKVVAFTFDDGPNPVYTPQILDIFREAGAKAKATFFMIGRQIEQHPELARTVHNQGHEIGNHTYTHPYLSKLSAEECAEEIIRTERLIQEIIGVKPLTFRPPYFDYNEQAAGLLGSRGYTLAGAVNGEAMDWEQPGVDHIVEKTRDSLSPGSVLLFHDGFGNRSHTVEAVRILVAELVAEGYRLVTVSELIKLSSPAKEV
ncbi:polysaccharide deacetylase family protein [Paenibacillus woosongensis]|uniref:Polysaccharide deacetylase family protein n=1 Tax=Paenibacillus woosongensis TaxID=307580 RepID=A0AA95I956_9BACL|nr:polysaccharide deacetylase family protein [Paenibacillus woosongensis]WHX51601.1 polysaccharide deacetylase family protein [Paenibacillus woosongensis]